MPSVDVLVVVLATRWESERHGPRATFPVGVGVVVVVVFVVVGHGPF